MAGDLWATPPRKKPIRGAYERNDFTPTGTFGPREAGSTFAGTLQAGAIAIPAAMAIEHLADSSMPAGAAFGAAWFTQALGFLVLKVIASMLRSYGASLFRDFGAWLWEVITGWFGVIWPDAIPHPDGQPRPGIIDRLFGLRRKRRIRRRRRRVIL